MICHGYFRKWLDIPVSGTVEILQSSKAQFGQEVIDTSTKHTLCQVTCRKCLKNSINEDIRYLHNATSEKTNNSLACFSDLARWGINVSASCTFCRKVQTAKHIVASCASCLKIATHGNITQCC